MISRKSKVQTENIPEEIDKCTLNRVLPKRVFPVSEENILVALM